MTIRDDHDKLGGAVTPEVHRILECLSVGLIIRQHDGSVAACNPPARELLGMSEGAILGHRLGDVVSLAASSGGAGTIIGGITTAGAQRGEFSHHRPDGSTVRIEAHVRPLRDEGGEFVGTVCTMSDVTERRLDEERSTDLADHLLLALSAGELGTWRWDMATNVTHWDEGMARLFGRHLDDLEGTYDAWVSMLHPDDRAHTVEMVRRAVESASSYEVEHRIVWPDGTVRWLAGRGHVTTGPDGEVTGTIGCASDITERKMAELLGEARVVDAELATQRERMARERLEFLASLNDAALAAADHVELMGMVTARAVPRLGDWCAIHFIGDPGSEPLVEAAHSDPAKVAWVKELIDRYPFDPDAPSGVAAVIRSGRPELADIDDAYIDRAIEESPQIPEDEARQIADALQLTSIVIVPLITTRGIVGAMQFVSAESGRHYDDDDVALAQAAAGRVAAALDNAWLSQQYRGVASALQEALLPVGLPTIPGADVAVRYWAAGLVNEVGGDFYDVFESGPDRWSMVIGDVCGTGPEAAAVTAKARHTIWAAACHGIEPRAVLEWVNEAMLANRRGRFCTVLYSTLDRDPAGGFTFTSVAAGHPLPIRVTAEGTAERLGRPGTLVGVLTQLELEVSTVPLQPGDTLVLYTDGITDVAPPFGLDEDAMLGVVAAAVRSSSTAQEAADALRNPVDDILPIHHRSDDMALVIVRIDD